MKKLILVSLFIFILSTGCNHEGSPVYIPVKPYIIIDKISMTADYSIVCVDANGRQFNFDVNFTNEDKYNVGDTIK